jgi:hypothetical protein
LHQLLAHVPYQLHKKQESYYHSLLIMICVGAGIKMEAELPTGHGRIDLIMELPNYTYVTEIEFNDLAETGLDEIKMMNYYDRYINQSKSIILLCLSFQRKPPSFTITHAMDEVDNLIG